MATNPVKTPANKAPKAEPNPLIQASGDPLKKSLSIISLLFYFQFFDILIVLKAKEINNNPIDINVRESLILLNSSPSGLPIHNKNPNINAIGIDKV